MKPLQNVFFLKESKLGNCIELLKDELNVHWEIMGTDIYIEMEGKLSKSN